MAKETKNWSDMTKLEKSVAIIILSIIGIIVLSIAGSILGAGSKDTIEKPVEKIVTVNKTPQSCVEVISIMNQAIIKSGTAMTAAAGGDYATVTEIAAWIKDNTPRKQALEAQCLAEQ